MPKSKYTAKEKFAMLQEFRESGTPVAIFCRQHGISHNTLERWQARFELEGLNGLQGVRVNRYYSPAFKEKVAKAYLAGEGTLADIVQRFKIRSGSQVSVWVSKYNGEKLAVDPRRKQVPDMGRKTTLEERIAVVDYVTKGNHTYKEAAAHFDVGYQQALRWVQKADKGGEKALEDRRGHRKPQDELTEVDKLRIENKRLKAQLQDKELLEEFAKKLQELQRRG